jgi:hypothetical protein
VLVFFVSFVADWSNFLLPYVLLLCERALVRGPVR